VHEEIVISGTGGQGVLLIGKLLAEVGLLEGREVAWLPTYGAEKRGGTVACNITISDDKIGSLFVTRPTAAIAMSLAALEKLEQVMKPDSLLIINKSTVPSKVKRRDVRVIYVPALELASELGNDSASNIIILGALVGASSMVDKSSINSAMESTFSAKYLEVNKQAFIKGYALGEGGNGN